MFACWRAVGIWCLLLASIASCVSGESVYLLLRALINFQSLDGFVRKLMLCSVSFHMVCCSCLISWSISVLSVLMRSRISGVGCCLRRWFLVCILSLMCELNVGL